MKAKRGDQEPGVSEEDSLETTLTDLKALRERYISLLKDRLVSEISRLTPEGFEHFSRALLQVYGFTDTCVTRVGTDGGLDGHGKLKVGLADLNVSFQCKRWTKGNVQRVEIDRFRGASQGEFEQGIFFTTSGFSRGAIGASIRRGAIPIVLIDGSAIVNLMIERRFGVDMQDISVPLYALDLAFE